MHRSILRTLDDLREAVVSIDGADALRLMKQLEDELGKHGIVAADRPMLERQLGEIRGLAKASAEGVRTAVEDVRTILRAGKIVQTYDRAGQRHAMQIIEGPARRY